MPRIQSSRASPARLARAPQRRPDPQPGGGFGLTEASHTCHIVSFLPLPWRVRLCTLELLVRHHTFVDWPPAFQRETVLLTITHSIFIELPSSVIFFFGGGAS